MAANSLNVLAVVGTLTRDSILAVVVGEVARQLEAQGCSVDVLDFEKEPLAIYNPDVTHASPSYAPLQQRVEHADVILLATPDYHGSLSGAMKNFLDHFWHEFAGKLFVTLVSSHEKGLTVTDQLRTIARQCYSWTLPYGVAFTPDEVKNGKIAGEPLKNRLAMTIRDMRVYGELLARQRQADLEGADPGFMARHRNETLTTEAKR
jgi:NAD(P)H-dependent FMN reductase